MIHWELHTPAGLTAPGWLEEISELRGRVLYESGRRPGFRRTDGRFADPDPRDMHAYHILARLEAQDLPHVLAVKRTEPLWTATPRGPDAPVMKLGFALVPSRSARPI